MTKNNLAPVALFVYNRLSITKKTIESLKKNKYASETDLYIYSDGGKDATSWGKVNTLRKYLKTINGFNKITIIERQENFYLERNLTEGITETINKHGKIIVLEDDIQCEGCFLEFMNNSLNLYEEDKKLMHIGASNLFHFENNGLDFVFSRLMLCSGWATWKDRWDKFTYFKTREDALSNLTLSDLSILEYAGNFKCLNSLNFNPIPWDICWYINIYKEKGLCLIPTKPLIQNIGLYSGTHSNTWRIFGKNLLDIPVSKNKLNSMHIPVELNQRIENLFISYFRKNDKFLKLNWLGKFVRFFYLKLIKRK